MASLIVANRIKKAKAKIEATATTLAGNVGHSVEIEVDWDFAQDIYFQHVIAMSAQRQIMENLISDNIAQCLIGTGDSLVAACTASTSVKSLVATITKISFIYDLTNAITSSTGARFLAISQSEKSLLFKLNLEAIEQVNKGDWGVAQKLMALAPSSSSQPAAAPPPPAPKKSIISSILAPKANAAPSTAPSDPNAAPSAPLKTGAVPPPPPVKKSSIGSTSNTPTPAGYVLPKPAPITEKNLEAQKAAEAAIGELDGVFDGFLYSGGMKVEFDYPSFIHTKEFKARYHDTHYACLGVGSVPTIQSLYQSVRRIYRSTDEAKNIISAVARILITLDVTNDSKSPDPALQWDDTTKTIVVAHSFATFNHSDKYDYTPRLEYILGIAFLNCLEANMEAVYNCRDSMCADFGLSSLGFKVTQRNPQFFLTHAKDMKPIIKRMLQQVPKSIFSGETGLKYLSGSPATRKALQDKLKKVLLIFDGQFQPGSSEFKIEINAGELVVRIAYESESWTTGIGPQLVGLFNFTSLIDNDVIDACNKKIAALSDRLRSLNSALSLSFDWKELQADPTVKSCPAYVDQFFRIVPDRIQAALEHSTAGAEYDLGLFEFLRVEKLALKDVTEIVFHMSPTNQINATGKHGLFTPYKYDVIKQGKTLHIHFNQNEYPVGVGALVEWVLDPVKAKDRQQRWISIIAKRNHAEELKRRDKLSLETSQENEKRSQYDAKYSKYLRDMEVYRNTPTTVRCHGCGGNGRWNGNLRADHDCVVCSGGSGILYRELVMPTAPVKLPLLPMPTFPSVRLEDFMQNLTRSDLRNDHYVELGPV